MHKRLFLWLVPAVAFVVLLAIPTLNQAAAPALGDPAPSFEEERLEGGGTLGLDDFRGRPLVINFWASWCGPCRDEAPLLNQAYEAYGDRIEFLGINIRDARTDAAGFISEHRVSWPSVRDEDLSVYDDFGLTGQPETFFIDHEGVVLGHVRGELSPERLGQLLDLLLARAGPGA